uniref:Uncharacterized protein n=1 Tax=Arundo donax TaxID=35708 RepID=A0A0A9BDK4_ARUDO
MSYLSQKLNSPVFYKMRKFFGGSSCRTEQQVRSLVEIRNQSCNLFYHRSRI